MKNKKSFILYTDMIDVVDELSNQDAGMLLKYILRYVNDLNPEPQTELIKLISIPIKQGLKRDLEKYKKIVDRNTANGKKGGRPPKAKANPKNPVGLQKTTIVDRKQVFKESLSKYVKLYSADMLNEFYSYWTEHGEKDKKMKFEKQKSFGIERRLSTWDKRSKEYNKGGNTNRILEMGSEVDSKLNELYGNE